MSQPDKPERPTEWPATVNTPYGVQENISEQEYTDLERQGLVRAPERSATTTRPAGKALASDSREN